MDYKLGYDENEMKGGKKLLKELRRELKEGDIRNE